MSQSDAEILKENRERITNGRVVLWGYSYCIFTPPLWFWRIFTPWKVLRKEKDE